MPDEINLDDLQGVSENPYCQNSCGLLFLPKRFAQFWTYCLPRSYFPRDRTRALWFRIARSTA
jgi:hypothetical protein